MPHEIQTQQVFWAQLLRQDGRTLLLFKFCLISNKQEDTLHCGTWPAVYDEDEKLTSFFLFFTAGPVTK
jgi:hypothetical protein